MKPSFSEYVESDYNEFDDKEPIRTRILRKGVGIIETISFDDNETITYCPHCRAAGFQVKLTNKILMPGEKSGFAESNFDFFVSNKERV